MTTISKLTERAREEGWWFEHRDTGFICAMHPTNDVVDRGERYIGKDGKSNGSKWYQLPPTADRWKHRSRTFQGIADAMAEQWGALT